MDTDDLSREAYEAVIIEAEKLTHDLTLNFAILSSSCKNETEFLEKAERLAIEIKQLDDYDLEDLLFGNIPDKKRLNYTLNKIIMNIDKVNEVPVNKRKYEF